ncbi:MAG: phosphate signaling complex protein PhoU [Ghiorsea sp.]
MTKIFDKELAELKQLILCMGKRVEQTIAGAVHAALEQDAILAEKAIKGNEVMNALEAQCDERIRDILARRQPAEDDLRLIMGTIKITNNFVRMGDLAADMTQGMMDSKDTPITHFSYLDIMAEKVLMQVHRILDAVARGDANLAMTVIAKNETIEILYKRMHRETLTYMMEDSCAITGLIMLTNASKNLERIADHATNIAEMVIYMERDDHVRHGDQDIDVKMLTSEIQHVAISPVSQLCH